jgi:hypothetical protein
MITKSAGQILNLFKDSEIKFLNSILNKLPDVENSGDRLQAYTIDYQVCLYIGEEKYCIPTIIFS